MLAQKGAATGSPQGISADLSRELARRLGVPLDFVPFDAAGKASDATKTVGRRRLRRHRAGRAADVAFCAPYVIIEGTYLVPGLAIRSIEEVDRPGVRIAIGRGSAYDLYLTRTLKNATLVRAATGGCATHDRPVPCPEKLEAVAGVRQPLVAYATDRTPMYA